MIPGEEKKQRRTREKERLELGGEGGERKRGRDKGMRVKKKSFKRCDALRTY